MESIPTSLFRRDIGFCRRLGSEYNYKRNLGNLRCNARILLPKGPSDGPMSRYYLQGEECPIFDIKFSPHDANILGAIDEAGYINLMDTSEGDKHRFIDRYHCQHNANMSFAWSEIHRGRIATGSADYSVKIIDVNDGFELLNNFTFHSKTVKTVKFSPFHSSDLLGTGSRDGSIMFWDLRCNRSYNEKPDNIITNAHSLKEGKNDSTNSVTDIVFQDENTLISCGASDGTIKFWDLRKTYKCLRKKSAAQNLAFPKNSTSIKGFSSLILDRKYNLYAATIGKEIFRFNLSTFSEEPDMQYDFDTTKSFYVKINLSYDDKYLISGSETELAAIWDTTIESPKPFMHLQGTISNICCGVFSPIDPLKICTTGDNSSVGIWRSEPSKNDDLDFGRLQISQETNSQSTLSQSSDLPLREKDLNTDPINVIFSYRKFPKKEVFLSPSKARSSLCLPMLKDLPDYNIDGKLPHIPEILKMYKQKRPLTWLGEFASSFEAAKQLNDPENNRDSKPKKIKLNLNKMGNGKGKIKSSPKTPKSMPTKKLQKSKASASPLSAGRKPTVSRRRSIESPKSGPTNTPTLLNYFTPKPPINAPN